MRVKSNISHYPEIPALPDGDAWLNVDEVSKASGLSKLTLADYRQKKKRHFGPPFHKFGRLIRYKESDVIAWIDQKGGA